MLLAYALGDSKHEIHRVLMLNPIEHGPYVRNGFSLAQGYRIGLNSHCQRF